MASVFNAEAFTKWLESEGGRYIQIFGAVGSTADADVADARNFANKMRENIGTTGLATVTASYNRVEIKLNGTPVHS